MWQPVSSIAIKFKDPPINLPPPPPKCFYSKFSIPPLKQFLKIFIKGWEGAVQTMISLSDRKVSFSKKKTMPISEDIFGGCNK